MSPTVFTSVLFIAIHSLQGIYNHVNLQILLISTEIGAELPNYKLLLPSLRPKQLEILFFFYFVLISYWRVGGWQREENGSIT